MRVGKTKRLLRQFLVGHIQEIYVFHISVIWAVYEAHPELIKTYQFKEGPRRVFKLTRRLIKKLASNKQEFSDLGLDPTQYEFTVRHKNMRLDGSNLSVCVYQITSRPQSIDDSFDVANFDVKTT
ncbi:MAG: hypothetical protein A2735_02825 [Candidatus Yanofskybacteria bacterium RIFCSPHIGHO2_01_FULL_41_21]|uniref:Uncharacterized protein n=1 Tax=Candidatus Yanofskybacteria bacterium RIFCSPHIGHO2_01_FULL_41_21 TaxID=1802660 RepID=A0A1F8ED51_9BACT|nr:MAG: hypothetical protein A2735_02825 [Candidatus Yanofskybacteria bacterium RIFCSPHIGHO2_01_FULL_41_21]